MGKVTEALVKAGWWTDQAGNSKVSRPLPRGTHPPAPGRTSTYDSGRISRNAPASVPTLVKRPPVAAPDLVDLLEGRRNGSANDGISPEQDISQPIDEAEPPTLFTPPNPSGPLQAQVAYAHPVEPISVNHRTWPAELITDRCKTIRLSPARVDPAITVLDGNDPAACERYQSLAVRLFNLISKRGLKTILVTSALKAEGKTTIASNLAILMAKSADRRVLLIDADSKRPSVARAFGIAPEIGWKELAGANGDAAAAIYRLNPSGLYICANTPGNAPELIGAPARKDVQAPHAAAQRNVDESALVISPRLEALLEDLKRHFSLIIIDAPPILDFAEAQRLAALADGVIVVAKAASTGHTLVTDALKLVPKDRRLGIVLNESALAGESTHYGAYYSREKAAPDGSESALRG